MVNKYIKRIYTIAIFLFLYAPIILLIIFSFNKSKSLSSWDGFSLKWYIELFNDKHIMKSLYYTLLCAVLSSIIATIIGTFAAFGIFNMKKIQRKIILNLNNLPLLNPDIVTGISLMLLFAFLSRYKLRLGFLTMLIAHITFNIPYVILSVLPKLKQMNKDIYLAAMDLGATPFYAFKKIVFPEILPGIITGMLIAFTMSVDDFVISYFTTGNGVSNLSITIYSMTRRGIKPTINALSTILFTVVLSLLLVVNKRSKSIKDLT